MILVVVYSGFFKRFLRIVHTWCVVPRLKGPAKKHKERQHTRADIYVSENRKIPPSMKDRQGHSK